MKQKLFGKNIEPACQYCEHGTDTKGRQKISCEKYGIVDPFHNCKYFLYAPLKRIPRQAPPLPQYNKEDFEL